MDGYRPRVLSLDGGGVRGWSQILLLGRVIYSIKVEEQSSKLTDEAPPSEEDLHPSDYFDLIIGTGTGGVNAIMIGRLGMSISQMKMAYGGLRKQVFESVVAEKDGDPLFSSTKLEEWAKALVKEYTGDENSKMIPTEGHGNTNGKGCKIGVTSMRSMNIGLPALFRSYRARANAETNCTIWEAIRATTASPLLFKSIKIGDIPIARPSYINAELGANNPVQYLMHEFRQVFAPPRGQMHRAPSAGCIVSLGTGKDGVISLRDYKLDDKEAKKKLYDTLLRVQKDCERAHQEFGDSNTKGGEKIYYRFNVEQGMQGIVDYDWEQDQHIMTQAQIHMEHDEYTSQFQELGERYVELIQEEERRKEEDERFRQEQASGEKR